MKYAAIESLRDRFPVSMLCELMGVSSSGYHGWRHRPASPRQIANQRLLSEIRVLHAESFASYGSPRIQAAVKRQGRAIGRERVRHLMRENRIIGRHRVSAKVILTRWDFQN